MKNYFYRPSGNDTALVTGFSASQNRHEINDEILASNPNIEQVGFISSDSYKLEMAGAEFCANATRAAIYHYLKGEEAEIEIITAAGLLRGGIGEKGDTYLEVTMPKAEKIDDKITKVTLDGITHLVVKDIPRDFEIKDLIDKYIPEDVEAKGVMFTNFARVEPIVWVRDIDTIFRETACGSGTIATLVASGKQELELRQPSDLILKVQIINDKIRLSGPVEKLGEEVDLNDFETQIKEARSAQAYDETLQELIPMIDAGHLKEVTDSIRKILSKNKKKGLDIAFQRFAKKVEGRNLVTIELEKEKGYFDPKQPFYKGTANAQSARLYTNYEKIPKTLTANLVAIIHPENILILTDGSLGPITRKDIEHDPNSWIEMKNSFPI
ncbi:MAG: hypothetical protein LBN08_04560 [Lactobacillales bacterium]|jgi:diaminopimelate epimerase|nr:hypothetical protein [Lactobacillales bacterium]